MEGRIRWLMIRSRVMGLNSESQGDRLAGGQEVC